MIKERTIFRFIIILAFISSVLVFIHVYIKRGIQGRVRNRSRICDQFSYGYGSEIKEETIGKNKIYRKFYKGGKLFVEGAYKHFYPEGIHKRYFPSGQLEELITYKYDPTIGGCDVKHGNYEIYYENGNIKTKGYYKNGKIFVGKDYDKNGNLLQEYTKINGSWHGQQKTYYLNGHVSSIGNFKSDNVDYKDIVYYDEEGYLTGKYYTDVGLRNEKLYYRSGELKREKIYRDDKLISEKCYDESGNVVLSCSKINKEIMDSNSDIWK